MDVSLSNFMLILVGVALYAGAIVTMVAAWNRQKKKDMEMRRRRNREAIMRQWYESGQAFKD